MKTGPSYIKDMSEYNEWVNRANAMQSAMVEWASVNPLSNERKTLWDNYCYMRDKFEEFKNKILARGMH